MKNILCRYLTIVTVTSLTFACSSNKTFQEYARAGDTVFIAAGFQPNISKDNITITITPSLGSPIILNSTDPSIRTVMNLYPDPVSSLIVSREIGVDLTPFAQSYAANMSGIIGSQDIDWYQTTLFVDLPSSLPVGMTTIDVSTPLGLQATSEVEIVSGLGKASNFSLNETMFESLSRVPHYVVDFDSTVLPYAVEVILTHDPDSANGGIGKAHAINHIGYKKNLSWADDGSTMKAIMTPSRDGTISQMKDFKFYIAGGVNNLAVISANGYDINGNAISGITATVTDRN